MPSIERKKKLLAATIVFLAISAALVLLLPLKLPLPVRLAVAGTDIIAALVVFVAWRQQGTDR